MLSSFPCVVAVAGLALVSSVPSLAVSNAVDLPRLDEVIVSGTTTHTTLRESSHGVAVITARDIEQSTAGSIGELLQNEAGLNVRSYFGTDRSSSIDLRGMGASAGSNVLILVDGVRQNANDLSGADLSSVPLASIERIEIIRGGGSVRYGEGAVGGIIHIYTRAASTQTRADVLLRAASYATQEEQLQATTHFDAWQLGFQGGHKQSRGYRDNGAYRQDDVGMELRRQIDFANVGVDAFVKLNHHSSRSGLPGPVSAEAFAANSRARRSTNAPYDESTLEENRYTTGAFIDFGDNGQLEFQFSQRERENPFLIGFNPSRSRESQLGNTQSTQQQANLHYEREFSAWGHTQRIFGGINALWADYQRQENGENILANSTLRSGKVDSHAWYLGSSLQPTASLNVNLGARQDSFNTHADDSRYTRGDCRTIIEIVNVDIDPGPGVILVPVPVPREVDCIDQYRIQDSNGGKWRHRAFDLGLSWQITPQLTSFISVARNFRNPNVDELLLAARDLRPQTGRNFEAGVRVNPNKNLEISAAVFRLRINNEIYFGVNATTLRSENLNFDQPTTRTGAELETRWQIFPTLALRWHVNYIEPRIKTADGREADIPLVPRISSTAQLDWKVMPQLAWVNRVQYVGTRYDGNDFDNARYPKLPAYTVFDTALRYEIGKTQLQAGVNNVFNKVYSSVAYSNTYYPMPQRNFYIALKQSF